jgi:hypothetical protein
MITRVFILWYLIGLLIFTTGATFTTSYNSWSHFYYVWAKASDVLVILACLYGKVEKSLNAVLAFALVRLVWVGKAMFYL